MRPSADSARHHRDLWLGRFPKTWFLPFTVCLVVAIVLAAAFGHTSQGQLDADLESQYAHAPKHFGAGELLRLLTSIPLTSDQSHLFAALVMSLLCVGSCEFSRGTWATIAGFFASHCITLATLAVGLFAVHALLPSHTSRQLLDISDVGPSAGYYGCLGLTLYDSTNRRMMVARRLVMAYLLVRVVAAYASSHFPAHIFQTDAAHLIAFLFGALMSTDIRFGGTKHVDRSGENAM